MLGAIMREIRYDFLHTYSKAPEASAKRVIDLEIMEHDFAMLTGSTCPAKPISRN